MNVLQQDSLARLILSTEYRSHRCRHVDHYYCSAVNLWRDFFRPDHLERLLGVREGHTCTLVDSETISYDPSWHLRLRTQQWRPPADSPQPLEPRVGRWYTQGFLTGVSTIYPQTLQPMRVVSCDGDWFEVECNHPLADIPITVQARIESIAPPGKERGGRCADWLEEALAGGPGMQQLRENVYPDYLEPDRFSRLDQADDRRFYDKPRLVAHLDSRARAHLLDCTTRLVAEDDRLLDLMSSMQSHVPERAVVTGLGMNAEEMRQNPSLGQFLVHDLNDRPVLPFTDGFFAVVCCHLSFEYLLSPEEVMAEVARVLRPEGQVVISFSNRWFPEKVTRIWQQLHDFERLSYVLHALRAEFTDFTTTTFRNWPRPKDDPHSFELRLSDPLYVVTGRKR